MIDRNAAEDLLNDVWSDVRLVRFSIDEWVDRIEALTAVDPRIDAVRALHRRDSTAYGFPLRCVECAHDWPCATIRALEGTQ